jgi:hypothetical protein
VTQPLAAYKDTMLSSILAPGSITTTPTPPGRYLLFLSLGRANCDSLTSDVVATVNGDSNVSFAAGGCVPSGASGPMFTYELEAGDSRDATIVLTDGKDRMQVQVENLLAGYQLQPRKAGFDPSLNFQEGANPVARGEVLLFDRIPNVRAAASLEANMSQEHMVGTGSDARREWTNHDVHPALMGDAAVQVTIPTEVNAGEASLSVLTSEHPTIRLCEGVASCEAQVTYGMETTVTILP